MIPGMPSARQRASHRRALYLILVGVAAAVACLLVEPVQLGSDASPAEATPAGAPPAAAIRPNPPTEPILGHRVAGPGG